MYIIQAMAISDFKNNVKNVWLNVNTHGLTLRRLLSNQIHTVMYKTPSLTQQDCVLSSIKDTVCRIIKELFA